MKHHPFLVSMLEEIRTLAADAESQVRSTPPGISFAEVELQDADHMLDVALGHHRDALSPTDIAACTRLKETLRRIASGEPETSRFWSNDGVRSDPNWEAIRRAAREALDELNRGRGPHSPPQA